MVFHFQNLHRLIHEKKVVLVNVVTLKYLFNTSSNSQNLLPILSIYQETQWHNFFQSTYTLNHSPSVAMLSILQVLYDHWNASSNAKSPSVPLNLLVCLDIIFDFFLSVTKSNFERRQRISINLLIGDHAIIR